MQHYKIIEEHFRKNRDRIAGKITMRTGSYEASEDIIQEAYYRALKYYKEGVVQDIDKWFSLIVTNCIREYMAAEKGHSYELIEEENIEGEGCVNFNHHFMRDVYKMIDKRHPVAKEVLTLHFRFQYSPVEVSRITPYSYVNCHKIINNFRKEVRKLLEE